MKDIKDFQFYEKKVLVRADFNVPIHNGKILDDFKIIKSLPTIKYLKEQGAKIILISHLGRPQEGEKVSLSPIAVKLEELLECKVNFINDCVGRGAQKAVNKMVSGDIVLLENLRFFAGEEQNDEVFAKQLANLAEIYINDAFACSHREHASIVGVPKLLPSAAGFLLKEEITTLSSVIKNPKRPLIAIFGGAKLETKLPCLLNFLKKSDHLIIGGMLAPVILAIKKIAISGQHFNEELEEKVRSIELTNPKFHMPIDALVGLRDHKVDYLRQSAVGNIRSEEQMFDIGPESVRIFSDIIKEAGTIIWNGPLGFIEDERFANGTLSIANAILRNSAFSVVGGTDTDSFLAKNNLREKFGYVSTGGGAMLEFLSGEEFPGIKALDSENE